MINHPAEFAVHAFLSKAIKGEAHMEQEVIDKVASDVSSALHKQFNHDRTGEFRLRMSNIGKPTCQLWFEKNKPELKQDKPTKFLVNMLVGDIVEAVFKGILRASGIQFTDNAKVTLDLGDTKINGEYDMVLDGKVDDIKSTTNYGFTSKFTDASSLELKDDFGYVAQLVGYARAAGKAVGGWWVVSKESGEYKYIPASDLDADTVLESIKNTVKYINEDRPFERCFTDEPETYRKVETGNRKLCKTCSYCDFKQACWPNMKTMESLCSTAKDKPMVDYTYVA